MAGYDNFNKVLMVFINYTDKDNPLSISKIAELANVDRKTVYRSIEKINNRYQYQKNNNLLCYHKIF